MIIIPPGERVGKICGVGVGGINYSQEIATLGGGGEGAFLYTTSGYS